MEIKMTVQQRLQLAKLAAQELKKSGVGRLPVPQFSAGNTVLCGDEERVVVILRVSFYSRLFMHGYTVSPVDGFEIFQVLEPALTSQTGSPRIGNMADSRTENILAALVNLRNEIQGLLGVYREEMIATAGYTNVCCLERRIKQAGKAVSDMKEGTK